MNSCRKKIVQSLKLLEFQGAKMTSQLLHRSPHHSHIYWTTNHQCPSYLLIMQPTHQRDQKHQMSSSTASAILDCNVKVLPTRTQRLRHYTIFNQSHVWAIKLKAQFLTPKSKLIHITRLVWKLIGHWQTCLSQHQIWLDLRTLELAHIRSCTMKSPWEDRDLINTMALLSRETTV